MTSYNNLEDIKRKYSIIYADPPWDYRDKAKAGKRGACFKYPTMKIKDIKELPIGDIAEDNCALFIWVTWPHLQNGLDVIKSWGFKYKTNAFVWIKMNKKATDTLFWGQGSYTRANSEFCLLAFKGKLKRINADVHSVIISPIGEHSRKPAEARQRIVRLFGDLPRIELFARETDYGWDCFGNEVNKFD